MKAGDFVWNVYHAVLRFGTIIDMSKRDDGWTYCSVFWYEDDKYINAIKWKNMMRNANEHKLFYRVDELQPVDCRRVIEAAKCHNDITAGLKSG